MRCLIELRTCKDFDRRILRCCDSVESRKEFVRKLLVV